MSPDDSVPDEQPAEPVVHTPRKKNPPKKKTVPMFIQRQRMRDDTKRNRQ